MGWMERWQNVKAAVRGETRIAEPGVRGRVYERPVDEAGGGGHVAATAKLTPSMSIRVFRAATGQWEDHGKVKGA